MGKPLQPRAHAWRDIVMDVSRPIYTVQPRSGAEILAAPPGTVGLLDGLELTIRPMAIRYQIAIKATASRT